MAATVQGVRGHPPGRSEQRFANRTQATAHDDQLRVKYSDEAAKPLAQGSPDLADETPSGFVTGVGCGCQGLGGELSG